MLAPYQAIKKRCPIFKTSPYVEYAFALENGPTSLADLILSVLNSNFMHRWGLVCEQVKAPKVYIADSGLLHSLLNLRSLRDLEGHPKVGASWEGFVIKQIIRRLGAHPDECFYWATHAGAELDLLVLRGGKRLGFEIKRTSSPRVMPSMRSALAD